MSIRVVASNFVREENVAEYLKLAAEIVEKTNALDAGCIIYSLNRSKQNPLEFAMIEEWETDDALAKHMQAAHFTDIIPKLNALCDPGKGGIAIYEKVY
ncbi:MAG: antibiotic biosynthesis monooxygenase [Oscillospiraceae bacterium]|jgi:quinol monooxygenase YgiN|nr:antibiotic biosynthesis monooxygenase [Oscillospiraceae bacterium]